MKALSLLFLAATITSLASAAIVQQTVPYELDGVKFEGTLIYDDTSQDHLLPGIVMIPNWMGPSENAYTKARMIADDDFAVFVADMYGVGVRPTNAAEAGKAAGTVRGDRTLMRARAQKAVDIFHSLSEQHPIDPSRTLAIGFCFGGGSVLELARTGTDSIQGIVSFHGDLQSPTLTADTQNIKIPVLVLHGADDPYVPQADVQSFIEAMTSAEVDDWTLVQFSGAVHSFTNPEAKSAGSHYDDRTSQRAFEMMEDFADQVLNLD
ncbi:dienelactone hydrolase family protein [Coraliomargarita sp. W4R72]